MSTNNGGTPKTFQGDLMQLPLSALGPLTSEARWVIWRWEKRITAAGETKWTKPPFQPLYPSVHARVDDPSTWGRYFDAVAAVTSGQADGVGFMLLGAGIAAIDIDRVRDVVTGQTTEEAQKLLELAKQARCYIEMTPSGSGFRIIMLSTGDEIHRQFTINATTNQGIEFYRNCARYITVSGIEMEPPEPELVEQIPELGDLLLQKYEAAAAAAAAASAAAAPRTGIDLNQAGPQSPDYDDLIRNGVPVGGRSEAFSKVVWYLASQGWSAEQIIEELEKFPGGIASKYITRLDKAVHQSFAKWTKAQGTQAKGRGAGYVPGAPPVTPAPSAQQKPIVTIREGEEERILAEVEAATVPSNLLFQRASEVVSVRRNRMTPWGSRSEHDSWQIIPVDTHFLKCIFAYYARLERYDARRKRTVLTSFPDPIARMYLTRSRSWKLPVLSGLVHTPFLRKDGTLCTSPGYDAASGLLFVDDDQAFPAIADSPSWDDAASALGDLEDLIREFPFLSLADQAVAMSLILTMIDRKAMATAPLHAFSSPSPGTGKGLLVNIASILATGRPVAGIAQGKDDEETAKRIDATLLAGLSALSIDNCDRSLRLPALAQLLSEEHVTVRPLGYSRVVRVSTAITVAATGNNLALGEDMNRRTVLCSLDAGIERPELREFRRDILEYVRQHRAEYVGAALTVLRAWHVAGKPGQCRPLGGFTDWSRRIRDPLIWLGRADPCATMESVRERDPWREAHRAVVVQWKEHLGPGTKFTASEIIARAEIVATFHTALIGVAADRSGARVSPITFSRWLKRNENKIVDRLAFTKAGIVAGLQTWALTQR